MTVEAALEAMEKARVLNRDRKDSDGLDLLLRAIPCLKAKWGKWDARLYDAYILSGSAYLSTGDYPKALKLFSLAMRVIGENRIFDLAQACYLVSIALDYQGKYAVVRLCEVT